jgi:hypothetical protein
MQQAAQQNPDLTDVGVWDYAGQCWVHSHRCPGERRVRVDQHGPLTNYAVFRLVTDDYGRLRAEDDPRPLPGWRVDYT